MSRTSSSVLLRGGATAPWTPTSEAIGAEDDSAMKTIFAKAPISADVTSTNRRFFLIIIAIVIVVSFVILPGTFGRGDGEVIKALRSFPESFRIAVISDPDKKSKVDGKHEWRSQYMTGTLRRRDETYSVEWDEPASVGTAMNEAGRGAELSELVRFNGGLYSFDDRTGIMFEITNPEDSAKSKPNIVPRRIFAEGDGHNGKGMKFEWATVKDGVMYIGSFGKEFTNNAGETLHTNNLWVIAVDKDGRAVHIDWTPQYNAMRTALGVEPPGYMIHEAVVWSPVNRRWFVLPRRVSKERYDEVKDEFMGANFIITASPDFSDVKHFRVGPLGPLRGFSSVKFLPGSNDRVLIALKSEENSELDRQTTYLTVFGMGPSGEWRVLLEETELPHAAKFEGLEVLSWS